MKLRQRLFVTTMAVSVPMVVGLVAWDAEARRVAAEDELAAMIRMLGDQPGWLQQCAAAPRSWTGGDGAPAPPPELEAVAHDMPPPRPPSEPPGPPKPHMRTLHREPAQMYAYAEDLTPWHPLARALPKEVQRAVQAHPDRVHSIPAPEGYVRVLVPMAAGSVCRFVLAEGTTEPWLGAVLPPTRIWLLPWLVLVLAVLLAVGPVIRRIRALTLAVQRSASSGYLDGVHLQGRDEVSELARAFDSAAARIRDQLAETQRREHALREFVANTTHDVMIPLTVLQGHLTGLQKDTGLGPGRSTVAAAMDEAHYLGALIHNLGLAARLESGAPDMQCEPVNLAQVVERVCQRHRPVAAQLQIALDRAVPSYPVEVLGDETMLERALSNLVYNAIRHNRRGGHVAIVLEAPVGGRFELFVLDDGPGISPQDMSRLTERGYRGNAARTREPGGQGLGLFIVHEVAHLHALELSFEPGAEGGLRVTLRGATREPAP